MQRPLRKATLLGAVALLSCAATAQMGTPIPEETKQLAYLVGTWEGDATFMFMGQESKGKAAFTAKMGVGGRFLVAEHTYEIAGMGQFHGLQIVGYDAAKKEWAGWWYDSAESGNMEMHGTIAGDLMTMTSKPTPMEGMGEVVMRTESKRVSDTRIEMRLSMKQGEEWAPMMVITYNKK